MDNESVNLDDIAAKLNELDSVLIEIEAKIENRKEEMKETVHKEVKILRDQIHEAKEHINESSENPDNFWRDLEDGIEHSWQELEAAMKNILSSIK